MKASNLLRSLNFILFSSFIPCITYSTNISIFSVSLYIHTYIDDHKGLEKKSQDFYFYYYLRLHLQNDDKRMIKVVKKVWEYKFSPQFMFGFGIGKRELMSTHYLIKAKGEENM